MFTSARNTILIVAVFAGTLLTAPMSASATTVTCGGVPYASAKSYFVWYSQSSNWKLLGGNSYWNGGTKSATRSVTVKTGKSVTASVSTSYGAKIEAKIAIAGLSVESHLSLQASGTKSSETSTTTKVTIPAKHTVAFFRGTRVVKGSYTYFNPVCRTSPVTGKKVLTWTSSLGTVKSWTSYADGNVDCATKVAKGTLLELAKQHEC